MKDDPTFNRFQELSWRRKLTDAEQAELQAWLTEHPEAEADWEADSALNAAFSRLPDAPVPSNFTARALQAVEREATAHQGRSGRGWQWWLRGHWLPKTGFAAVLLAVGLVSYRHVQTVQREKLVESVAAVSAVSSLPSPEILKDFDAIQALSPAPAPDEQLLAALQ